MPSIEASRKNGKCGKFGGEQGKKTGILGKKHGEKGGRPKKLNLGENVL